MPALDPVKRFWSFVIKTRSCWIWNGAKAGGYGQFRHNYAKIPAHRFAYESCIGIIPNGLVIHHECRNKLCVRPTHLKAMMPAENCRQPDGTAGKNVRKTECPQGHAYNKANTHIDKTGRRHCRTCDRDRMRQARGFSGDLPNGQKTHCKHGHLFDDANTYWRKSGGRQCKVCRREIDRK